MQTEPTLHHVPAPMKTETKLLHVPAPCLVRRRSCRRLSYAPESLDTSPDDNEVSPVKAAVMAAVSNNRRASLNCNVEYAVAMVNDNPTLNEDDGLMCAFGTRRDSMCSNTKQQLGRVRKKNLKKKKPEQQQQQTQAEASPEKVEVLFEIEIKEERGEIEHTPNLRPTLFRSFSQRPSGRAEAGDAQKLRPTLLRSFSQRPSVERAEIEEDATKRPGMLRAFSQRPSRRMLLRSDSQRSFASPTA